MLLGRDLQLAGFGNPEMASEQLPKRCGGGRPG
jgi:hypothetical protein